MKQAINKKPVYTYNDYLNWPDEERWEIVNGEAYNITPAPSTNHQMIVSRLNVLLSNQMVLSPCTVFIAQTDVVLSEYDIVQPDLFVVCDKKKITEKNIQGAPDLIIEILSPSTALKDLREKKALYEKSGVREYIIVDPLELYIQRFVIGQDGKYGLPDIFGSKEILIPLTFKEVKIKIWELFDKEPPDEEYEEEPKA